MKTWTMSLSMSVLLALAIAGSVDAQTPPPSPSPSPAMPGKAEGAVVRVRGTVSAVDKENKTITLKGPRGRTLTFDVQDPTKLETVKVGDPVVGTYLEAVAVQVRPAGSTTPSATVTESRAGSKPGDNPAGAIRREVSLTGKIVKIDTKAQRVTLEGPKGGQETIKIKDPKNLQGVKVGDLVEITYLQALVVALDKPKPEK
jgi:Cu/Ag efflux protein CusF